MGQQETVKKYDTEFKGIVLNKKQSTKPDSNGNMITKDYWTVLVKGQPIESNGKRLCAFASKSTPGNLVIMAMDSKQSQVAGPIELSDAIASITS